MHQFTIKDVENLSGIKAHTIRIWEKRYSFLKPLRSDTNIRFYSWEELRMLLNVGLLNKYGYKISAIARMPEDDLSNKIENLKQSQAQDEYAVNQLVLYMFKFDADNFEKLLNTHVVSKGIAACMSGIVGLFLEKIVLMQNSASLNAKVKEIFSKIIRQKIIAAIEGLNDLYTHSKTVLVFLPEDVHYETELLYMQYLMKHQGLDVIYLGANVPLNDVIKIAFFKKPDYVYTQLNNEFNPSKTVKYLEKLSAIFQDYKIIITARQLSFSKKEIAANMRIEFSFTKSLNFLL